MKLYIMQHGVSFPRERDEKRPLNGEGVDQTREVAEYLRGMDIAPAEIWHSTKTRSVQTAQIVSRILGCGSVSQREDMGPGDDVGPVVKDAGNAGKDLMIIGHMPFLSRFVSSFLSGDPGLDAINFRNSAVLCMESGGIWKISWYITPLMIPGNKTGSRHET